ncbi:hypothetical protein HanIR_Chr03g0149671 [Helianthus annuus]|nr:hypothetical protein HanIR_Chr03g0149671 [Helianthus annuus]
MVNILSMHAYHWNYRKKSESFRQSCMKILHLFKGFFTNIVCKLFNIHGIISHVCCFSYFHGNIILNIGMLAKHVNEPCHSCRCRVFSGYYEV